MKLPKFNTTNMNDPKHNNNHQSIDANKQKNTVLNDSSSFLNETESKSFKKRINDN